MLPVLTSKRKPLPSFYLAVIDPAYKHGQFVATDLYARLTFFHPGELKCSLFESSIPDGKSITIPIQNLQLVTSSIDEQEQLTGQWIHFKHGCNKSAQPIKSFSHIRVTEGDEDACVGSNAYHDVPPIDLHAVTASSKIVKCGGGNPQLRRNLYPVGETTSMIE